jgi:hypothetical protein
VGGGGGAAPEGRRGVGEGAGGVSGDPSGRGLCSKERKRSARGGGKEKRLVIDEEKGNRVTGEEKGKKDALHQVNDHELSTHPEGNS